MPIKNGDKVKVHYTGTLEDGTEFDSSRGGEPLAFTMGEGQLIPGFEAAIMGLEVGGSVKTEIPPAEAYGEFNEEMTLQFKREDVPSHIDPEVGMMLQLGTEDGGAMQVTITEVTDEQVTLDANHPLAGKTLTFDIEVVEIG